MVSKNHSTGMRGVYLVAAELSRLGFIATVISRNALGADILVADHRYKRVYSVQVKTNARSFSFWLLNKHAKDLKSKSHRYVFVNLKEKETEYFIVPSEVVSDKMYVSKRKPSPFYSFAYEDAKKYENKWSIFKS